MEKTKHIVILAAGDFPTHHVPLAAMNEADFVVCCDSAYSPFSTFNGSASVSPAFQSPIPYVVIGDGDSLSDETKQELGNRWIQVDEQDYNDLHKAMAWATSTFDIRHSKFTILAATGRREDHTLGNISYLVTFNEEYPGLDLEMLTDYGRFCTFSGSRTFPAFPRQQVSIFTLDPHIAVSSEGLRWELDCFRPQIWWQATLNEVLGNAFSLVADGPVILFRTHEKKP